MTPLQSLLAGLDTLKDETARKAFLGAAYKQLVGYDPFDDDPTQSVLEVAAMYVDIMSEHLSNA